MEWSKAKNIMIIALFLLNIFLASTLYISYRNKNYIPNNMVLSVSEFFDKNGVFLDSDVIPAKKSGLYSIRISNNSANVEICKNLLGDSEAVTEIIENGFSLVSKNGNAEVIFNNSFIVNFFESYDTTEYKKTNENKKLSQFIYSNNLLPEGFDIKFSGEYGNKTAQVYFKGNKLFGCYFEFVVKDERLVSVSSNGQLGSLMGYGKINARDGVNCLFDLLQNYPEMISESQITSLEAGYSMPEIFTSNFYILIPTWLITKDNGEVIRYNMETAKIF